MSTDEQAYQTGMILTTALASFVTGYMFGIFTTRGYLISPALAEERRRYHNDPVESDESDVDVDGTPLDHAPNWANGLDADRRQGLRFRESGAAERKSLMGESSEECKLVLVVRTDLGMTKGKIAAQCSHAALACYKALASADPSSPERRVLSRWERFGQAKIAVQVKSQAELLELRGKARAMGLTAEVIQDAGRTQIEAGSMTVLGVGPGPKSLVDKVTGGLKLL
ncbi:PTH2-domain-containing protein [Trichoderma citrinoviride]|uniref:peptidyl-tRNA hydrolase n=1 Tax=Trichoderma citrinoviride TaxID=58853 RepID=A0A2T4B151_9HYPO|nr:PTH2-domain-containing protein [Trichoderma citrinoviride]PTB63030.1 PTH2-domain-containing protein [Trichoderma citrinoviride]